MSSMSSAGPPPATAKPTSPTGPPATPPKRLRWAWDVVIALGVLALVPTMAAAIPLSNYFEGRYGSGVTGVGLLFALLTTVAVSFVVCVVRLVAFWRRMGLLGRVLRLVPLALAVLFFVPSSPIAIRTLRPSIQALLPDDLTAYLYGFRDRMRATADWKAIRQWAKETHARRPKSDSTQLELPPCIKSLDPLYVTLATDAVVLKWHVGWYLINPPTCAALVVFTDDGAGLESRPDAHRIAPGVWVAYWPEFD